MDERELVDAIRLVVGSGASGVRIGIGDDAAVLEPGAGELVLTADVLVEGVDYVAARSAPRDIGAKAMAVNLSDMAAMGASPRYALVSLGLPNTVDVPWVVDLYGGMRDVGEDFACAIVGGDLSSSPVSFVSISMAGAVAPGKAVTRSGAEPGDALVVTGPLGAAAGGLALVAQGEVPSGEAAHRLLEALARPVPRVAEGQFLASRGATAMMDLSDGLARDLHRLCRASGVGSQVHEDQVPVDPALREVALPAAPEALALRGGEDFQLIATIPPGRLDEVCTAYEEAFFTSLAVIGTIVEGDAVELVATDGSRRPLPDEGWDHFG